MRRQHRSMGLALTVVLLASCARSGVDDKIASTSDSEQAKVADTSNVVVTGSRIAAPQLRAESIPPMAVMAPPAPPPPPPAPGMYVPQWASPPYHDQGRDKFTQVDENPFKIVREAPVSNSTFSLSSILDSVTSALGGGGGGGGSGLGAGAGGGGGGASFAAH